jgi:hypothetical protein
MRPGGWLMAQGPLEAGPCLFTAVAGAGAPFGREPVSAT